MGEIVIHHQDMDAMTSGELLGLARALTKIAEQSERRFPGAARFVIECAGGLAAEMQRRGMIAQPTINAHLN
jgi:hypothetical protein